MSAYTNAPIVIPHTPSALLLSQQTDPKRNYEHQQYELPQSWRRPEPCERCVVRKKDEDGPSSSTVQAPCAMALALGVFDQQRFSWTKAPRFAAADARLHVAV